MTIPKRRKTHRGKRGGKKHGNPGFPPKGPSVPPQALAALLGGGGPDVGAPQDPGIAGAPPSGPDPSLAPLLAALAKHAATQGMAQPGM